MKLHKDYAGLAVSAYVEQHLLKDADSLPAKFIAGGLGGLAPRIAPNFIAANAPLLTLGGIMDEDGRIELDAMGEFLSGGMAALKGDGLPLMGFTFFKNDVDNLMNVARAMARQTNEENR